MFPRTGFLRRTVTAFWPAIAACACMGATTALSAGTPYDAQIGGFIAASMETFIYGEFAGRRAPQIDVSLARRTCRADEYAELRSVTNDEESFENFYRKCRVIEYSKDETHVHGTAYIPAGSCERLKTVFERLLLENVYAASGHELVFEHNGARYSSNRLALAAGARLSVICLDNGALRMSAPRKRR